MSTPTDVLERVARLAPDEGTARSIATVSLVPDAAERVVRRALTSAPVSAGETWLLTAAPPRRRPRRALAGVAAATVLGVVAAVATVVLPSDGPGGPSPAAAAEIERLAIRAAVTPADLVGPGQLVHTVDVFKQDGVDEHQTQPRQRRESWVRPDGGSWVRTTGGGRTETRFRPRWDFVGLNSPTPDFLAGLPTEPGALADHLHANVTGSTSHERAVFTAVGDMLRPGFAPPELRAAALRVLLTLPHVDVEKDVSFPSGTTGTAIVWTEHDRDGVRVEKLVVDPSTARVLGELTTIDSPTYWLDHWSERVVADAVDDVPADVRRTAVYTVQLLPDGTTVEVEHDAAGWVRDEDGRVLGRLPRRDR